MRVCNNLQTENKHPYICFEFQGFLIKLGVIALTKLVIPLKAYAESKLEQYESVWSDKPSLN